MSNFLDETVESGVITPEVTKAYNSSRLRTTRRIAFFERDGVTPWQEELTSRQAFEGSVMIDGSRDERRSFSLKVLNTSGIFDPKPDGLWYDKIIKCYKGIRYRDAFGANKHFEYKLGEFMIDKIDIDQNSSVVDINGRDYTKKLLLDEFDEPTLFNEGSNLDEMVKAIALNGGVKRFNLGVPGITVTASAAFEAETSRWEAIKKLCEPHNVEVFFDNEGRLVTRLYKDVSKSADQLFDLNVSKIDMPRNLISAKRSLSDTQVFNAVRVYATGEQGNVTGARFVAVREDKDPQSPTSIQRIGRRPKSYSSDLFASQQQVDEYADRFIANAALQDCSFSFESMMYPWLEANDVIRVYDDSDNQYLPVRYLLSEFTVPVGLGTLSGSGKRITKVGHVDDR